MSNFGKVFKTLRKQRNLTQEQAAEFLGVSTQAISKWETGASYPDISLLTIIADFFSVSVDCLLNHDVTKRNEDIERICNEADVLIEEKRYMEALSLMREAQVKYPGNDVVMYKLAWALRWSIHAEDNSQSEENYDEAMLLYLKLLEISTDTELRAKVTRDLVYCYYTKGDSISGLKYANQLPPFSVCREYVLGRCNCLEGKELSEYLQSNIKLYGEAMIECMEYYLNYKIISEEDMKPYSPDIAKEKISLVKSVIES